MSGKIAWKKALFYGGVVLLGIVVGPFVANLTSRLWHGGGQAAPVQAQESVPVAAIAPDSPEATYICTPSYIGSFTNRVHVLCTAPATGGIYYFAAPTSDSKQAARVLSIMLTAKSLGKNLQIYYSPTGNGASYGCQSHDCRPITAIEMTN